MIESEGKNCGSVGESRVALHKFTLAHRFYSSLSKKDANYTRAKCTAKECPRKLTASQVSQSMTMLWIQVTNKLGMAKKRQKNQVVGGVEDSYKLFL